MLLKWCLFILVPVIFTPVMRAVCRKRFAHGTAVVDKDGVTAAVIMAELANFLATAGKTLVDQLYEVSTCLETCWQPSSLPHFV